MVTRTLRRQDGTPVGSLEPESLALEGSGPVLCQTLLDVLPAESLPPGDYSFQLEATGASVKQPLHGSVEFSVGL